MSLLTTRAAIVAHLDAAFKRYLPAAVAARVDIAAHEGIFDEAELAQLAVTAPAVRVALLGTENISVRGGAISSEAMFGVFVATVDGAGDNSRDVTALALLPIIIATIANSRWGLESSEGNPSEMKGENMLSSHIDGRPATLWSVNFRQRVTLSGGLDGALQAVTEAELSAAVNSADGNGIPCPQKAHPIAPGGYCATCRGTEHTGHKPLPGTGINDLLRAGYGDALQKNTDKGLFPVRK